MSGTSPISYIGSFPPPYGGVTVKNDLIFRHLSNSLPLEKVDLSRMKALNVRDAAAFVHALLSREGSLVIGMSRAWRRHTTLVLYMLNREKMARSVVFVMGGAIPTGSDIDRLAHFRRIYVETEAMRRDFEGVGLPNAAVYPNCRERPKIPIQLRRRATGEPLSCVYFSHISVVKGAGVVLRAAAELPEAEFNFYGQITPDFKDEFLLRVRALPNATYHGVFDSARDDAIGELVRYDVHLFPTMAPHEGVPGVIVETKVAGLPTLATNRCHNAGLIADGADGLLMSGDSSEEELAGEMVAGLRRLADDPSLLASMKAAALASAESFYIDNHVQQLIDVLGAQPDSEKGKV